MPYRILLIIVPTVIALSQLLFIPGCVSESIDDLSKNSKKKQPNNLTCFVCHSDKDRGCLKVDDDRDDYDRFFQPCGTNETFCTVKRISFTTMNGTGQNSNHSVKLVAINRNCAPKCDPGCVIMGERTRLYVCSTCCQAQLCNTGNSVSNLMPSPTLSLVFPLLLLFLVQLLPSSVSQIGASPL